MESNIMFLTVIEIHKEPLKSMGTLIFKSVSPKISVLSDLTTKTV